MHEFGRFLVEHWNLVLISILSLVQLILFFVRKRPVKVVDAIGNILYENIPYFINEAESFYGPGHGDKKLEYVLDCARALYKSLDIQFDPFIEKFVIEMVEEFLSTPQKKVSKR